MTHTTQQLLMYAKTNPDAFDRVRFKPLDLYELCEKVAMAKVPFIYAQGFEFAFDAQEGLWINGGPIILESLIQNLLDNALIHARDNENKPMGTITLSLHEENQRIILSVCDEGPGIAKEYLEKVCERFFRVDMNKHGSGLGLGIVQHIAQLHNATMSLSNRLPHGLEVRISFPLVLQQ